VRKDIDIVASGYPSLDRIIRVESEPALGTTSIIRNDDNATVYYGGCNVNVTYICSRLGLRCAPLMRVGKDFADSGFRSFLEDAGTIMDGIEQIDTDTTSCSYLVMTEKGDHITLFYPGAMSTAYPPRLNEELIRRAKYGVLTVGNPDYNVEFAKACLKHEVPIIFGMKCDFDSFSPELLPDILHGCEIVFMNEVEQETLNQLLAFHHITELLNFRLVKALVVTMGSRGSHIYARRDGRIEEYSVGVAKTGTVVDTTGCGDAYLAGFMYAYIQRKPLQVCGRMGAAVSSFVLEKTGCLTNVPDLDMLLKRYRDSFGEEF
jgi:adenosine kinase